MRSHSVARGGHFEVSEGGFPNPLFPPSRQSYCCVHLLPSFFGRWVDGCMTLVTWQQKETTFSQLCFSGLFVTGLKSIFFLTKTCYSWIVIWDSSAAFDYYFSVITATWQFLQRSSFWNIYSIWPFIRSFLSKLSFVFPGTRICNFCHLLRPIACLIVLWKLTYQSDDCQILIKLKLFPTKCLHYMLHSLPSVKQTKHVCECGYNFFPLTILHPGNCCKYLSFQPHRTELAR